MCCAILFVFMSFDHRYYNYCFQTQICLIFRVGNACLALMKWNTQLPYWKIFLATYYGRFFILTTLWKSIYIKQIKRQKWGATKRPHDLYIYSHLIIYSHCVLLFNRLSRKPWYKDYIKSPCYFINLDVWVFAH